jgi:hypothetical protein
MLWNFKTHKHTPLTFKIKYQICLRAQKIGGEKEEEEEDG